MTMSKGFQPWRRFAGLLHAVVALGLPFLRISGESALRFDVPTLTLRFFGAAIAMDEFFLVLVAVLFLTFLFVTLTIILGRIWCGWLCPQTVIVDATRFVDRMVSRGPLQRVLAAAIIAPISFVLAAGVLWYFVPPEEFFLRLRTGSLGHVIGLSWSILGLITFLNFAFLRRTFCSTVCPYAKMQGALFDDNTLVIAEDPARRDECMHCEACVKTCPVGIDIRKGLNAACINCAECIDACVRQMARRQRPSLIGYRFGSSDAGASLLRRPVLISGTVTALFLVLLVMLSFSRLPMDMDVTSDPAIPPRLTSEGRLINAFILSFTNRSGKEQEIALSAAGAEGALTIDPSRVRLEKGAHERLRVVITMTGSKEQTKHPGTIEIKASSPGSPDLDQTRRLNMLPSW